MVNFLSWASHVIELTGIDVYYFTQAGNIELNCNRVIVYYREIIFESRKFWGSFFTLLLYTGRDFNGKAKLTHFKITSVGSLAATMCWNFSARLLDVYKVFLSRGNCWNWHSLGDPGLWLRGAGADSQAASGSRARAKVCVPIIIGMGGWDTSHIPWWVVLVTGSKSNGSVAQSLGL